MQLNKIKITPSVIPNLFTAMNMFCGFLSIIYASQGKFIIACYAIIAAAVFDALDGFVARLTNSCSEIGVQLDSLCDVISFGAAPAYLMYSIYFNQFQNEGLGIFISSLPMVSGGFRLARFNVQLTGFEKTHFKGLPIPSSALTLAAFIMGFYSMDYGFPEQLKPFIIPLVLIVSYLMVSTIKYDTLPRFSKSGILEKPHLYIIGIISLVAIFVQDFGKGFFYFFVLMIVIGIFRHIYSTLFKAKKK